MTASPDGSGWRKTVTVMRSLGARRWASAAAAAPGSCRMARPATSNDHSARRTIAASPEFGSLSLGASRMLQCHRPASRRHPSPGCLETSGWKRRVAEKQGLSERSSEVLRRDYPGPTITQDVRQLRSARLRASHAAAAGLNLRSVVQRLSRCRHLRIRIMAPASAPLRI